MRFLLAVASVLALFVPDQARGERFLTIDEARKLCFPKANRFEPRIIRFTAAETKDIEKRSGVRVLNKGNRIWLAREGTNLLGVMFVDYVLGKHELIDYVVAVDPSGAARQVEILEYRESYGGEIRGTKWRDQFKGKTASSPLKLNGDIYNISGATISCRNVNEGIKRVLATYEQVVRPRLLIAGAAPAPTREESQSVEALERDALKRDMLKPHPAMKIPTLHASTPQRFNVPDFHFIRRSKPLLGTFVVISAYGHERNTLNAAITVAFDEFERIDAVMSLHRTHSELSQLNSTAAHKRVPVSEDLARVIGQGQEIAAATDGSFDVTIRPLADLWGFIWKEYRLPNDGELAAVLPRINYRFIELDERHRTVRYLQPGVTIDLGGIAKGYAVDCAIEKLRLAGISNAMVRAGGDLRAMGAPPGESSWPVQLEDSQKHGMRTTIPLRDSAVSTSGNYENCFVVNGHRYGHILNPRTGLPVEGVGACNVIARTCMESDAWATACCVYGMEKTLDRFGDELAVRFTVEPACETRPRIYKSAAWNRSVSWIP